MIKINKQNNRPIIGITLDYQSDDDSYSRYPWYALRADYAGAVESAGGVGIFLPYQMDAVRDYVNMCDGLIVSGGDFDISPNEYGEDEIHKSVTLNHNRTQFERRLLTEFLASKKPLLGICGGQQLINVVLGGTLIQHIPDDTNALQHEQPYPKHEPTHSIKCLRDSLFYQLVGNDEYMVNTTHHQAVKKLGNKLKSVAVAPDGIIEAIELEDHPFCIGVQWHPEFYSTREDKSLIDGFVKACLIP